mmetsp:Transcript_167/g.466  ORF Transcript_167/g.466 Transcript_167/m.466 type:complete len:372 (+) Transcript_167:719-1834(+)
MSLEDETRRQVEKPHCTPQTLLSFIQLTYTLPDNGLDPASLTPLSSHDDLNFRAHTTTSLHAYVLKIHNGVASQNPALLAAQSAAMRHLNAHGVPAPAPVTTTAGADWAFIGLPPREGAPPGECSRRYAVRVMTWVDGEIAAEESERPGEHAPALLRAVGGFVGRMSNALASFAHPGTARRHLRDVANALSFRELLPFVENPSRRAMAESILADFERTVLPLASSLPRSVLHNNATDRTILLTSSSPSAILSFSDLVTSWRVNEPAIAAASFAASPPFTRDPVAAAAAVLAGFEARCALSAVERGLLPVLVAARLVCSCVCGEYSAEKDPANREYLLTHQEGGWAALKALIEAGNEAVLEKFSRAVSETEK